MPPAAWPQVPTAFPASLRIMPGRLADLSARGLMWCQVHHMRRCIDRRFDGPKVRSLKQPEKPHCSTTTWLIALLGHHLQ